MSPFLIYGAASALLVVLGMAGVVLRRHLVRQVLALNVMGGGTFLFLIATAHRDRGDAPDPVPHAMVLTGIVVAVSVSAFALALARRIHANSGRVSLREEDLE